MSNFEKTTFCPICLGKVGKSYGNGIEKDMIICTKCGHVKYFKTSTEYKGNK